MDGRADLVERKHARNRDRRYGTPAVEELRECRYPMNTTRRRHRHTNRRYGPSTLTRCSLTAEPHGDRFQFLSRATTANRTVIGRQATLSQSLPESLHQGRGLWITTSATWMPYLPCLAHSQLSRFKGFFGSPSIVPFKLRWYDTWRFPYLSLTLVLTIDISALFILLFGTTAMATSEQSPRDDVSYQTVIVVVVSMVLVTCAVILRLTARKMMKLKLMADDYMIILAAVRWASTVSRPEDGLTSHSSLSSVMLSSIPFVSRSRFRLPIWKLT